MKKIPKKFKVMGLDIKITHELPPMALKMIDMSTEYVHGLYIPAIRTIWINPQFDLEEQWRTLYHEIGHALMYRISLPYNDEFTSGIHEQVVETYANFIYENFHVKLDK